MDACSRANRNILRVSALWLRKTSWDMCKNLEWVACAARGALPHQGPTIHFATPPSRMDPRDADAFREYKQNILRWSAHYEIDTLSWSFFAVELCVFVLVCDNADELWTLSRGNPFVCAVSNAGKTRLRGVFEHLLIR